MTAPDFTAFRTDFDALSAAFKRLDPADRQRAVAFVERLAHAGGDPGRNYGVMTMAFELGEDLQREIDEARAAR